jgi:uncharacterized Fe-S cluster protein YjdI
MSNRVTKTELEDIRKGKLKYKEYANNEVSVFWKADLCIHSANCLISLPEVFDNAKKPWINIENATAKEIIKTINTCPSRALLYLKNSKITTAKAKKSKGTPRKFARIQILKDGPILVTGNFIIRDENKKKVKVETETAALCRCGASKKKPLCDGRHLLEKFKS